jgi:hypothetical protein
MTNYQLLNNPNNLSFIVKLIRNGIKVDSTLIQHLSIYDKFYALKGSKMSRYKALATEYNLHYKTIQKIIIQLNNNAK